VVGAFQDREAEREQRRFRVRDTLSRAEIKMTKRMVKIARASDRSCRWAPNIRANEPFALRHLTVPK
jgi:hypothetical protein